MLSAFLTGVVMFAASGGGREIVRNGGIVRFVVPAAWVESQDDDGTPVYFAERENSGALRLSLTTFKSPTQVTEASAQEILVGLRGIAPDSIRVLPNGNAVATQTSRAEDDGTPIVTYWWYIANPVRPSHVRLAVFSFTIEADGAPTSEDVRELEFLASHLPDAHFHPALGE